MLLPIFEDEVDEYEECTYKVLSYEPAGLLTFVLREMDSMKEQVELVTGREYQELINSELVYATYRGEAFSLEDLEEEDLTKIIGEEITVECC